MSQRIRFGTDTTIATLDVDGVTLATLKVLQAENVALLQQVENLIQRVERIERHK